MADRAAAPASFLVIHVGLTAGFVLIPAKPDSLLRALPRHSVASRLGFLARDSLFFLSRLGFRLHFVVLAARREACRFGNGQFWVAAYTTAQAAGADPVLMRYLAQCFLLVDGLLGQADLVGKYLHVVTSLPRQLALLVDQRAGRSPGHTSAAMPR